MCMRVASFARFFFVFLLLPNLPYKRLYATTTKLLLLLFYTSNNNNFNNSGAAAPPLQACAGAAGAGGEQRRYRGIGAHPLEQRAGPDGSRDGECQGSVPQRYGINTRTKYMDGESWF